MQTQVYIASADMFFLYGIIIIMML